LQILDRVLSRDIVAGVNVPPHNNSAMDGYALNARALPIDASCELRVIGSSFAGAPFTGVCGIGECIRIMTGGVLPAGLDTVIPQELVEQTTEGMIRVDHNTPPGSNIRLSGEDIRQGETVLSRGRRITAADLGVIASLGIAQATVTRRLKVAFFSTGDELKGVNEALQPGDIYDSNRYLLYALLSHQHCQISDLGVVKDDPVALRAALQFAAAEHDVVITTGGVSVGEADHVKAVLADLGSIAFWKVAIKPGRPLTFGHLGKALFFGLPGNPVAVMVNFSQFVQPALQCLAGENAARPLTLSAVTTSTLKKRPGRTEFQRGILSQAEDGSLLVSITGAQGSGILLSMSRANCFIVLPNEATRVAPGSKVIVQPFAGWL
jgi:molybdopterin molybdotransferase